VRISLRKVVIVLAILTIAMTGAAVYTYVDYLRMPKIDPLRRPASGPCIWADEINGVSLHATVITDPHPILIEAVKNPNESIYLGNAPPEDYEAVLEQLRKSHYVEYEGKYYGILRLEVDLGLEPPLLNQPPVKFSMGFSALAVCWIVVGYFYYRKKKETTRHEKG